MALKQASDNGATRPGGKRAALDKSRLPWLAS